MKKQLLTSTALVTAGMMAAAGAASAQGQPPTKPQLFLGGWFEGIFGIADQDLPEVGYDAQIDAETHFKSLTQLDNGITIATRAEIEIQGAGGTIDEAYMGVSGSFGEIRVGSEDNVAHGMVTGYMGSWATQVGQNLHFDTTDFISTPSGNTVQSINRLKIQNAGGDAEKIMYFSPRVAGFQVSASYMPGGESQERQNGTTRSAFFDEPSHGYAVAARYDTKFDNIGFGVAAGYAEFLNDGTGATNGQDGNGHNPKGFVGGVKVDIGSFRVAAGGLKEWNNSPDSESVNDERWSAEGGVRYRWGKNNVSLTYAHAETEGSRAIDGEDELDHGMLSYRRDLGPGIQYRLNGMYVDFTGEDDTTNSDDNDGWAVSTSVRVSF